MDVQEIVDLWNAVIRNRALLRLSIIVGLGGFLFGFDTGVYPSVIAFLRNRYDLVHHHRWMLDVIKIMINVAALIGAGFSGLLSDWLGRRSTILFADIVYFLGAILTVWPSYYLTALLGRFLIGAGIGLASVSCPLYVGEIAPSGIRGALISLYGVFLSAGYLCAYAITAGLVKEPGWSWMLGLASIPTVLQLIFMYQLVESPRWLIWQDKLQDALNSLKSVYSETEATMIFNKMRDSFNARGSFQNSWAPFKDPSFKNALFASISVQLPHIIGAEVISNQGPLETTVDSPIITATLQLLSSIVALIVVEKYGRRKILIISLVLAAFLFHVMSFMSFYSSQFMPGVHNELSMFDAEKVCAAYSLDPQNVKWNCFTCLQHDCGFCASQDKQLQLGACLVNENATKILCEEKGRKWYEKSCPSKFGTVIGVLIELFGIVHSVGLATIPVVVNAEIFPARYLGIGGGLGSMAGWILNLIRVRFFTMAQNQDPWDAYTIQSLCAWLALFFVCMFVPETRGIPLEEMDTTAF